MRGASLVPLVLAAGSILGACADVSGDPADTGDDPATYDAGLEGGGEPADASADTGDWGGDAMTTTPPPEHNDDALLARSDGDLAFSREGMSECYDATCEAPGCQEVRSCCVGAGTCCAPVAASMLPNLGSADCDDGAADTCLAGVATFGEPTPSIIGGAISPGGDGAGDSGLLTTAAADLTVHRLTVTADFTRGSDCLAGCFETAGVGITSQSMVTGELRTLAALQYSAARDRLLLMVRDVVIDSIHMPDLTESYVLDLQPTGEVAVRTSTDSTTRLTARYTPTRDARVAVFGHSINPSFDSSPTTIRIVEMALGLCDVPTGWGDRRQVLVDGAPVLTGSASLAAGADRALAYEDDGGISFALGTASEHEFTAVTPTDPAVDADTVASLVTGAATFSDPELVRHEDGWRLFFTLRDDGVASIAHRDFSLDFQTAQPVVVTVGARTMMVEGANDVTIEVSEPTVIEHESGVHVLAVRARTDTESWLEVYRTPGGTTDSFNLIEATSLRGLTARGAAPASGFSRDEVGQPALSIHNGAWHLHFAARRGTRSSIGLLVSDNLIHWRSPTGTAVLDAGAAPWEALGVSAPDAVATGDMFEMVYAGLDGWRSTLAWATRRGTDSGGF